MSLPLHQRYWDTFGLVDSSPNWIDLQSFYGRRDYRNSLKSNFDAWNVDSSTELSAGRKEFCFDFLVFVSNFSFFHSPIHTSHLHTISLPLYRFEIKLTDPNTKITTIDTAMVMMATTPLSGSSGWINVPSGNVLFPAGRTAARILLNFQLDFHFRSFGMRVSHAIIHRHQFCGFDIQVLKTWNPKKRILKWNTRIKLRHNRQSSHIVSESKHCTVYMDIQRWQLCTQWRQIFCYQSLRWGEDTIMCISGCILFGLLIEFLEIWNLVRISSLFIHASSLK